MQRHPSVLEHRTDLHRELTLALAAAPQADADALLGVGLDLGDAVHAAAVRAHRLSAPDHLLKVGEGGFLVVKLGAGQDGHNGPR